MSEKAEAEDGAAVVIVRKRVAKDVQTVAPRQAPRGCYSRRKTVFGLGARTLGDRWSGVAMGVSSGALPTWRMAAPSATGRLRNVLRDPAVRVVGGWSPRWFGICASSFVSLLSVGTLLLGLQRP